MHVSPAFRSLASGAVTSGAVASGAVPPDAVPPRTSGDALVDAAGPVEGSHVAVLGADALPVLCALIRRGAAAAAEHRLGDRTIDPAEIAIAPSIASLGDAVRAVGLARRSLLPCGRIVLRDVSGQLEADIISLLRASGFATIRAVRDVEATVVIAERPFFGPLTHTRGRA